MKIIKKIAAIMLSVMMVLGMCSVVGAEGTSETSATKDGKITITNAVPKQKYTIYQILELESFSDKTAENPGNYAYKATTKWKGFVESETGETYLKTDGSGYVTWVENADPVAFAKAALAYAKDPTNSIVAEKSANAPDATEGSTTSTVTFEGLSDIILLILVLELFALLIPQLKRWKFKKRMVCLQWRKRYRKILMIIGTRITQQILVRQ